MISQKGISFMNTGIPMNLTTNADERPVSVRTAADNKIDQINNTPNAKKLYNAKIIGGATGIAVPLIVAVVSAVKAVKSWGAGSKFKSVLQAGLAAVSAYYLPKIARVSSGLSETLTVFFSTRGKSKAE